jgi:imidazolonepropionase
MKTLIHHIGLLAGILPQDKQRLMGKEMAHIETITDAFLLIEDGRFCCFGTMRQDNGEWAKEMQDALWDPTTEVIDAKGGAVLPCWCDSHTHIVYAGSREGEFTDKIRGLSYEEIAARGGGILNSADLLHETDEETLYAQAKLRLDDMERSGTG